MIIENYNGWVDKNFKNDKDFQRKLYNHFKSIDISPKIVASINLELHRQAQEKIEKWCRENCKGKWYRSAGFVFMFEDYTGFVFMFEDMEDVLLFKLTWG